MPTRFEHRATFTAPASTVYATLVDRAFLEERLRVLGGKNAAVIEHGTSGDEVRIRLRQAVDAELLPGTVRAVLKGDLVVEREERWKPEGDAYAATGRAAVSGMPGEITTRSRLAGDELVINAEVRVGIPLIGGKLEGVIAQQVGRLLAAESEFAGKWLTEHGA